MSNKRYIELYSGNRDREQYPHPASFEVPFAPTMQNQTGKNARDPIVNGSVYYKFITTSTEYYNSEGDFATGSSASSPILNPNQTGEALSSVLNYYVGWYIVDTTVPYNNEAVSLITGYNPSTASLTLLNPLGSDPTGHKYGLYSSNPTTNYISIPTLDINQNYIANYELAYNGYYLVFESPNPTYSNPYNSNIFYRTITYYDNVSQIAYFDTPLPSTYHPMTPQTFTLRKTLPNDRWTLNTPSFINTVAPADPNIGPLIGPVITLPPGASTVDNFYKGKFVYYYSNAPETYPKLFPPADIISGNGSPVNGVFFPIYGSYYINAYNASTRQLSVCYDLNDTPLPTYVANIGYDSASFTAQTDLNITQIGPTEYQADITNNTTLIGVMDLSSQLFTIGKSYEVTWHLAGKTTAASPYFTVTGLNNTILYTSSTISDSYTDVTFTFIPTSATICFNIYADTEPDYHIQWDSFVMSQVDTINICNFESDNFVPLSYSGSMLSINETACYEVTLMNLTLPNASLVTGSRIAFYPYVYVEFANATSPNGASRELIYSNNPHSNKALFIASVPQAAQPILNTFMALSGGMSQVIKFKPNDNLRFSVYLPDGTLFQTLENDILTPYPAQGRVQIEALFTIRRI